MKQVTIRLNEQGQEELAKVRELTASKSSQSAIEFALHGYRYFLERSRNLEAELSEAKAVIKYLEEQLKARA